MKREKECAQCSKMFSDDVLTPSAWERRKYCSGNCMMESRKGKGNGNFKGGKLNKICIICNKNFYTWPSINKNTCSLICHKAYTQTEEFRSLMRRHSIGRHLSDETRKKISEIQKGKRTGSENPSWKGNEVGYRAMHDWVIREKGRPDVCEHCGLIGKEAKKRLVWANKSHQYLRDVNDWMRLCYRCHRKYDFPNEKHPN